MQTPVHIATLAQPGANAAFRAVSPWHWFGLLLTTRGFMCKAEGN